MQTLEHVHFLGRHLELLFLIIDDILLYQQLFLHPVDLHAFVLLLIFEVLNFRSDLLILLQRSLELLYLLVLAIIRLLQFKDPSLVLENLVLQLTHVWLVMLLLLQLREFFVDRSELHCEVVNLLLLPFQLFFFGGILELGCGGLFASSVALFKLELLESFVSLGGFGFSHIFLLQSMVFLSFKVFHFLLTKQTLLQLHIELVLEFSLLPHKDLHMTCSVEVVG